MPTVSDILELLRTNDLANVAATAALVLGWGMGVLTAIFTSRAIAVAARS